MTRNFVQLPNRLNSGPVIPSIALGMTSVSSEEAVTLASATPLSRNIAYNMRTSLGIQVGVLPASRINEWVKVVDVDGNSVKNPIFLYPPTGQTILGLQRYKISEAYANAVFIYDGRGNWYTE